MLLGLAVYFFKMRVGTLRVNRKNIKREPKMFSLVTVDGKSSPDKILPYQHDSEDRNAALAGSVITLLKNDDENTKVNYNTAIREARKNQ